MAFDAKAKFVGLVTATAESTGDGGGLRIADNVVLRKEGALVCRPSFSSSALSRSYLAAFPYKGQLVYIGPSNTLYDANQAALLGYDGATTAGIRNDTWGGREARSNFYFATSSGIWKITAPTNALERTGLSPADVSLYVNGALITTGTPLLLANNQQVAYRIVAKRTDANGVVLRSRPTGAGTVINTSGVSVSPQVTVSIRPYAVVDEVEVYRSRVFPTTAAVDEEFQLVAAVPLAQFTGTPPFKSYTFTDRVADTARSTTLYTSPSRGGIENANDRPPGAACIERYRGSLFFGNTRGPQRFVFSYKYNGSATGEITGQATGLGRRLATGNTTAGSPTITSVSSVVGVQVGASVNGGGGIVATVISIVGSTVTLSGPAPSTLVGTNLIFFDAIRVTTAGTTFASFGLGLKFAPTGFGATSASISDQTTVYEITPPLPGYDQTVVLESTERGGGANVAISAPHGDEFNPPIPLTSAGSPLTLPFESTVNGLQWTEPDEPEHAPPKNFARVGDTGKAILGLVATRDRLLIFKEDGLFMLTGDTAANFAIYPLDTTCLCILPGSIRRLQNTVYVLTNLGLVAVDESGGVTVVSRPIQNEVATIVNAIRAAQKISGLYLMPGLSGVTGAGDDANGEYWLALGSSTPSFGGHALLYSLPRNGFTTYTFTATPVALSTDGEGNPLVLTATALLTPTTTPGVVAARVSPRGFCDPALLNKLWTHVIAGFSQLTGTASVQARFTSSTAMVGTPIVTEAFDLPLDGGSLIQLPNGSLLRHPTPLAVRRAYMLLVELLINVTNGTFTLDMVGAESRENVSNKKPTIGSGAT